MWIVYAQHKDTLASAEQTLACNAMLIRNKLLSIGTIREAFQLWAFCMHKYPQAIIKLAREDYSHAFFN